MSSSELEAFLVEMEPDIRTAERDMQEIEALEKKGVTGAGKLGGEFILPAFTPILNLKLQIMKPFSHV
jgi:hypothetical protein